MFDDGVPIQNTNPSLLQLLILSSNATLMEKGLLFWAPHCLWQIATLLAELNRLGSILRPSN